MASYETLKSGKVRVFLHVNGARKSATFTTKQKARSWAREKEYELSQQTGLYNQSYTLLDLFRRYANDVSPAKRGKRWETGRLYNFEKFERFCSIRLVELQREDIEDWIDIRLTQVMSSTVNRELNLISHCLTQARRWRLMTHTPFDDLRRPKNPPSRFRRIDQSEIQQLCLVMNYHDDITITQKCQCTAVAFLFAIETGMRAGEICSLSESLIDFNKKVAHLPMTKNGYSRDVPLSPKSVELLQRLPKPTNSRDPIFQLKSDSLSTLFRKYCRRTNIKNLTFHDTRHEAITRLASKLDVLDLARVVGHRDIRQLMTYYNKSASELSSLLA
jgi:integrase